MNPPSKSFRLETLPGKVLHEAYEVEELIGMGAMGAVYRGRQIRLRRTVAIKVPKPDLAANSDYIQRFEREALTMAKLVHENVVQIFDVYVSPVPSEPSFIVMEYVEGCELETFLHTQERSLTVAAVCDLLQQIARGIDAANARGIVHRDIKPSNIVITLPQRVAKIMDFGIARVEMENVFATQDTKTMGTPAYMAPEQVTAKPVGPPCDIYAFSMMIFRLLARRLPYDCSTSNALLFAQVHTPPLPLDQCNPIVPRAAALAVAEGLAKKPGDRPATATQLALNLTAGLQAVAQRPYGELFAPKGPLLIPVSDGTATALTTESEASATLGGPAPETVLVHDTRTTVASPQPPPGLFSKPMLVGFGIGAGMALVVGAWAILPLLTGSREPVSPPPPVMPATPLPTPAEPAPTPIPSIATPTPAPSPSPSPRPTPSPSPTPLPSPSPSPSPQPTPSPKAEVAPASTPVATTPTPTPGVSPAPYSAEFDPAVTPHLTEGWELDQARREVSEFAEERIERAIYRGWWSHEANALVELGGPYADAIKGLVDKHSAENDNISVKFKVLPSSVYWEDHALLRIELSASGRPKSIADPNFRRSLFALEDPLIARVRRVENRWRLEYLWGNYTQLQDLLKE